MPLRISLMAIQRSLAKGATKHTTNQPVAVATAVSSFSVGSNTWIQKVDIQKSDADVGCPLISNLNDFWICRRVFDGKKIRDVWCCPGVFCQMVEN